MEASIPVRYTAFPVMGMGSDSALWTRSNDIESVLVVVR